MSGTGFRAPIRDFRITDYHRELVACYYSQILYRFGGESLHRHIAALRRIVWTRSGRNLVERRCS